MSILSKSFALLLILAMFTSGIIMLESANAETKPSVPQFRCNFTHHSHDTPAKYSTDQFTGQQVLEEPSSHEEWTTLDLTVPNHYDGKSGPDGLEGWDGLLYEVRYKGPYTTNWTIWGDYFKPDQGPSTVISLGINTDLHYNYDFDWENTDAILTAPAGSTVELQMQADLGNITYSHIYGIAGYLPDLQESGWSATQSVIIPQAASTPTPIVVWSIPGQQQGSFYGSSWGLTVNVGLVVAVVVMLAVIGGLVVLLKRKPKKPSEG
jgi:hypothetical protein